MAVGGFCDLGNLGKCLDFIRGNDHQPRAALAASQPVGRVRADEGMHRAEDRDALGARRFLFKGHAIDLSRYRRRRDGGSDVAGLPA